MNRNRALASAVLICAACAARVPAPDRAPSNGAAELRVLNEGIDGTALLSGDAVRATAVGAGPLRVIGADAAAEGDRVGAFVEIPEGECMLAFSRSSPTIVDIDLFAFEDDGSAFATDESPAPQAAIVVCPPHPRRLYVVARVMAGSGIVGVGVQSVPRVAADAVAKAVGARGRPGEDTGRLDGWPGLEAKLRAHRSAIGGRWEDVRRVAIPVNPRAASRVSVSVEAGRCVDVFASPSDEIASLEMVAEDESSRIVARGRDHAHDRSIVLCSPVRAQASIGLRPRASQGLVAVAIGRSPVGAEPEIASGVRVAHLAQTVDIDAAKKVLARALAAKDYGQVKSLGTGTAKVGARSTFNIDVPAGCARIDIVAGKPLVDVLATLWDGRGQVLAEGSGGAGTPLFACGKGEKTRMDLEAVVSPGPFEIELRRDSSAPPNLVAHPVAASRLLARLSAEGEPTSAAAAKSAVVVAIDASSQKTLPLSVPANSCVEVIAALDDGAGGIDLRITDTASGEGAFTRSQRVATERLCAGVSVVSGRIELRALSGKAEALVLTRVAFDK